MWKKNLLTIRTQFKQTNINNSEKQNVIPILFTIAKKCEKVIDTNTHKHTYTEYTNKQNKTKTCCWKFTNQPKQNNNNNHEKENQIEEDLSLEMGGIA